MASAWQGALLVSVQRSGADIIRVRGAACHHCEDRAGEARRSRHIDPGVCCEHRVRALSVRLNRSPRMYLFELTTLCDPSCLWQQRQRQSSSCICKHAAAGVASPPLMVATAQPAARYPLATRSFLRCPQLRPHYIQRGATAARAHRAARKWETSVCLGRGFFDRNARVRAPVGTRRELKRLAASRSTAL